MGGSLVEDGFEQGSARSELIVDGQARDPRGLRDAFEREILNALRGPKNPRGGGNDPLAGLRRSSVAAGTIVTARAQVDVLT